ncbi:iron-siderophore ABC transporter substrate-binding protein [Nakamurella deserti]|uniref:iron-siderophore ABC transporter substrate-binding protein n=1 Tax=Nakamurella deserti TaxID=2164074 RepID=UPI00197B6722|nr:iron-siderophore ABC transporter substrate-binding protein [Nakamurella deserti]
MSFIRSHRSVIAAGLAVVLLAAAGCGSDSGSAASTTTTPAPAASSDAPSAGTSGSTAATFPVTIEHAFGSTEIPAAPERVVALGWGSADAALALGVVPVGVDKQSYGADADGFMPWFAEALTAAGGDKPAALTTGDSPAFEEIIATDPDLILATYSGITEADYAKLSAIAPTVAYPETAWSTPWRDVITTAGTALGKSAEAETLLSDIDGRIADAAAAHPEFAGKTIAAVAVDPAAFYVYTPADPRVEYLEDLGFTVAPSVTELDTKESTFFYTLSLENVDKLTSDVLLSYAATEERTAEILADPTLATMSQIKAGTVATISGESLVSSVSPPTALSLPWGLDDFVSALSAAAAKA